MPPAVTIVRPMMSQTCMFIAIASCSCWLPDSVVGFGSIECPRQAFFLAVVAGAFPEPWAPNPRRTVAAFQVARGVFSGDLIDHQILRRDDISLQAQDFGDMSDPARPIAKPCRLDDDINRGNDHFPKGPRRQREATHGYHGFEAA